MLGWWEDLLAEDGHARADLDARVQVVIWGHAIDDQQCLLERSKNSLLW